MPVARPLLSHVMAERGKLLDAMYAHLRQHFIEVRRKEGKANGNKKKAKKGGRGSAGAVAAVVEQLRRDYPEVFRRYPTHFLDPATLAAAAIDTFEVPPDGLAEAETLLDGSTPVRLRKGKRVAAELHPASALQAQLLVALIGQGIRGMVIVPHDPADCTAVLSRFTTWVRQRDDAVRQVIERQVAEVDVQDALRAAVLPMVMAGPASPQLVSPTG